MKEYPCPFCESPYTADVSDFYTYERDNLRTKRFCLTCTNSFFVEKELVKSLFTTEKPISLLEVESYVLGKSAIHIILKNSEAKPEDRTISVISRDLISVTKDLSNFTDIVLRLMIYVGGPSEDDQVKLRFESEEKAKEFINDCKTHVLKVFWNGQ